MRDSDFGFNCMLFVIAAVLVGFGGWGLAKLLAALHHHFLTPTYQFALVYFANYGRATGEIACGVIIITMGLKFHHKIISEATQGFLARCKEQDAKRNELEHGLALQTSTSNELRSKQSRMERDFWIVKEENLALQTQMESLKQEIERLSAPEKVAERERRQEQEQAKSELMEHIQETEWRELG